MTYSTNFSIEELRFDNNGLIPAIAQDWLDGSILMLAWMNKESLNKTLETRNVHYWSRSRSEIWRKGSTSGSTQFLKGIRFDCDNADLQSRLSLLTTFKLPAWELDDFERLLSHLAHDRGLKLSDEVTRYLTIRIQRRPLDAVNIISTIDESTLVEKRSPTIPFLKLLDL